MKHPYYHTHRTAEEGSVLVLAMITIVILASILGVVLQSVSNKYWTAFQVASWQEALFASEGGADIAMVEMRKEAQNDSTAWSGWTVVKQDGSASTTPPGLATLGSNENLIRTVTLTTHAGEGNTVLSASLVIDAPTTLKDASGRQWFRVRATGTANVPGPARVSSEKLDNLIHRLSLVTDRKNSQDKGTTVKVAKPMAQRTIECIVKPATMFAQALMTEVQIKNDSLGLIVDSYNSKDATKSTNGLYDAKKRQSNGDIGSNAFPIKHDKTMDMNLTNDYIFGDVGNNYSKIKGVSPGYFDGNDPHPATNTNSLITTDGNAVPTGVISTAYYRDLPRIEAPNWTVVTKNVGTLDGKDGDVTASTNKASPTRIIATSINLSNDTWVVKSPTTGVDSYVEIWVQGDITLKDGGIIQFEPGVHATVYFAHNITIDDSKSHLGAGFDPQSDKPADCLLLGIEQKDTTKKNADLYGLDVYTPYKATGNIVIKDADFNAAVYAPDHNMVVDVKNAAARLRTNPGQGRTRLQSGIDLSGAFVGRTIHTKGPANFHYDEALADAGPANDYSYVSWFETVNLDKR